MFLSGREAAGIWEGEWRLVFRSSILEGISLRFASVEDVCGASLKIHWTTKIFVGVLCERVAISSWGFAVIHAALGSCKCVVATNEVAA